MPTWGDVWGPVVTLSAASNAAVQQDAATTRSGSFDHRVAWIFGTVAYGVAIVMAGVGGSIALRSRPVTFVWCPMARRARRRSAPEHLGASGSRWPGRARVGGGALRTVARHTTAPQGAAGVAATRHPACPRRGASCRLAVRRGRARVARSRTRPDQLDGHGRGGRRRIAPDGRRLHNAHRLGPDGRTGSDRRERRTVRCHRADHGTRSPGRSHRDRAGRRRHDLIHGAGHAIGRRFRWRWPGRWWRSSQSSSHAAGRRAGAGWRR